MALSQEEIRRIVQLRGLGYTQQAIADDLGISRKTVESHLRRIRKQADKAKENDNIEEFFVGIVLGAAAAAAFLKLLGGGHKE